MIRKSDICIVLLSMTFGLMAAQTHQPPITSTQSCPAKTTTSAFITSTVADILHPGENPVETFPYGTYIVVIGILVAVFTQIYFRKAIVRGYYWCKAKLIKEQPEPEMVSLDDDERTNLYGYARPNNEVRVPLRPLVE